MFIQKDNWHKYNLMRSILFKKCCCIFFIIFLHSTVFGQPSQSPDSIDKNTTYSNIYFRSLVGSLVGWAGAYDIKIIISTLGDRSFKESVLYPLNCCAYPLMAVGAPIGSALMMMANPRPPVNSIKEAWPLFLIGGLEMSLYHFAYGNGKFKKNNSSSHRLALRGASIVSFVVIPLSHLIYLKRHNRTSNRIVDKKFFENPKSLGLVSWREEGLQFRFPGVWMEQPLEIENDFVEPLGRQPRYFFSLFNINF